MSQTPAQTAQSNQQLQQGQFREEFKRMSGEFVAALPPQITPEKFMRVVLTAVNSDPDLLIADRRSLLESAMKAAQDGLLPDKREGAFVVFNSRVGKGDKQAWVKKVQWMPMIGGIIKKARNSGEILSLSAHVVYENDEFTYILGDDELIEHRPTLEERGKVIAAYAIARTKNGGIYREVMTRHDIDKVRGASKSPDSGPWASWYDEMARKSVLRRLAKYLPMSSDLERVVERDDALYPFKDAQGAIESRVAANSLPPAAAAMQERLAARGTVQQGFNQEFVESALDTAQSTPAQPQRQIQEAAPAYDDDFPGDTSEEDQGGELNEEAGESDFEVLARFEAEAKAAPNIAALDAMAKALQADPASWYTKGSDETKAAAQAIFQRCYDKISADAAKVAAAEKKAAAKAAEAKAKKEAAEAEALANAEADKPLEPIATAEQPEREKLISEGYAKAAEGMRKLNFWSGRITQKQYDLIADELPNMQAAARKADEAAMPEL